MMTRKTRNGTLEVQKVKKSAVSSRGGSTRLPHGFERKKTWKTHRKLGRSLPVESSPLESYTAKTHQQRVDAAEGWRRTAPDSLRWLLPVLFLVGNLETANFWNSHVRRCSAFMGSGVRTSQSQRARPRGRYQSYTWGLCFKNIHLWRSKVRLRSEIKW